MNTVLYLSLNVNRMFQLFNVLLTNHPKTQKLEIILLCFTSLGVDRQSWTVLSWSPSNGCSQLTAEAGVIWNFLYSHVSLLGWDVWNAGDGGWGGGGGVPLSSLQVAALQVWLGLHTVWQLKVQAFLETSRGFQARELVLEVMHITFTIFH